MTDREQTGPAARLLGSLFGVKDDDLKVDAELGTISFPVSGGGRSLTEAVRAVDAEGYPLADIALRRPSLDDVFLALTGHGSEDESGPPTARRRRRARAASAT
jgi:ABC-2 type transport system ATP-binding protein